MGFYSRFLVFVNIPLAAAKAAPGNGSPVLLETETHPRISLENRHLERANLGREKSVRMDLSVFINVGA
jgi:hypothetical protein